MCKQVPVLFLALLLLHAAPAFAADPITIHVKDTPLDDVAAMRSKASGTQVKLVGELGARRVTLDVTEATLEDVLAVICKDQGLRIAHAQPGVLVLVGPMELPEDPVECAARFIEVDKTLADEVFAPHLDAECFRMPEGWIVRVGRFDEALADLQQPGKATLINEPHMTTASGQPGEITFMLDQGTDPQLVWPNFRPGAAEVGIGLLPRIEDDDHLSLVLTLRKTWFNDEGVRTEGGVGGMGGRNAARRDNAYSISSTLPKLMVATGQTVLLRGWSPPRNGPNVEGRELIIALFLRRVMDVPAE